MSFSTPSLTEDNHGGDSVALLQADDLRDSFRGRTHTIRHDDGREYWTFTAALPPPELARYVNSYWEVDGALAHVREKVLPTADIVLIFNLGDVQHLVDRDDQVERDRVPQRLRLGAPGALPDHRLASQVVALRYAPDAFRRLQTVPARR